MILMGDLPRITDPSVESHPEDVVFCRSVANALSTNSKLNRDIVSMLMNRMGLKSSTYHFFADSWKEALDIARIKIDAVLEKRAKGELTEEEASSYLNQAMDRQMEQAETTDDPVTVDEVKNMAVALLTASVDTTSGLIAWNLVHIAQNPDVQERIRQELMTATGGTGKLTPEAVSPKAVPYLHAAIRESHRLTSPSPLSAFRIMPGDVQVHGVTLPENSMVVFDGYSKGVDPTLVEDADTFKPSRFLPEAVESRKGKPSEVIDHPLFSGETLFCVYEMYEYCLLSYLHISCTCPLQVPSRRVLVAVLDLECRETKSTFCYLSSFWITTLLVRWIRGKTSKCAWTLSMRQ
jgi:hypothetical protein